MATTSAPSLARALEDTAHRIQGVAEGLRVLMHATTVTHAEIGQFLTLLEDTLLEAARALEHEHYRAALALDRKEG